MTTDPLLLTWRKSSYSTNGGDCIEIATSAPSVFVRDSKNPEGGILAFGQDEWRTFLARIKAGEIER
ncbi:DUF397 domain-containing protein [Spongiactinospora rosea]|uniref:DUF397 domain-containing protein n=1 Tax=Spongiactinospora rosea TaxID=2248750 RepID=A0A366LL38_9ACTN|nr:DUF397 domain-containing protein [Spongiactinospora rosea]RBQ14014.1 DUF397 domain-containing protein [Spongiactinospora rosea]